MKYLLRSLWLLLALAVPAHAQVSSDKPVRIVVPFAAGGPTDVIARVLAPKLAASLKRSVIVENRVGATGAIGASFVAKSAPDGDTLLLGTSSIMAANPNLATNLPFDPVADFTPVPGPNGYLIPNYNNKSMVTVHPVSGSESASTAAGLPVWGWGLVFVAVPMWSIWLYRRGDRPDEEEGWAS